MSSILKKLMAFAILIIVAHHLEAQVPGSTPGYKANQVIPKAVKDHSLSRIKADLIRRYPQYSSQLTRQAPLSRMHTMQSLPTLEQIRQNLIRRHPQWQQQINLYGSPRTLRMGNRGLTQGSAPYDRAMIQKHMDKLRMQVEQTRQRNLQMQRQQQQRSIQLQMQQQMQQPAQEAPVQQLPVQQRPMQQQPVEQAPVHQPSVKDQLPLPKKQRIPTALPVKQYPGARAANR